jgi:hypothetical protein
MPIPKYAAPVSSSGDCYLFHFTPLLTCGADRSFPQRYYDTCQLLTQPPQRDPEGCVFLPGYTLQKWPLPPNLREAVLPSEIPWQQLPNPTRARASAAADMPLMAARCSAVGPSCLWFSTRDNATLHSYLPLLEPAGQPPSGGGFDPCQGIYIKQASRASCPRVDGYLFKPRVSAAPLDALPICSECSDAAALAAQCNASASCGGFSNLHGLLSGGFPPRSGRAAFTDSECYGSWQRVGGGPDGLPAEVEALDRLLCGPASYCDSEAEIEYQANVSGASVDIRVVLTRSLALPRALSAPDSSSALALPALPRIRSLTVVCADGAQLSGGAPRPLFVVFPNLQELIISGCGMTGPLPPEWAQVSGLKVIDVSSNALTGGLPEAWSALSLAHLNMSWNLLSGELPSAW